jgi:hypothetical protein
MLHRFACCVLHHRSDWDKRLGSALTIAPLLWIAFSFVLLAGAVLWENAPITLALIHAGDWLIQIAIIATIAAS